MHPLYAQCATPTEKVHSWNRRNKASFGLAVCGTLVRQLALFLGVAQLEIRHTRNLGSDLGAGQVE
jgi:hypothetical protein